MKRLLILGTLWLSVCISLLRADQFVTGQSASSVLGQSDFFSGDSAGFPNRLDFPEAVAVDPTTGKVFVADSGNFRILRFSSTAALVNGSFPEAVIGQPNFSATLSNQGGAANANTLAFVYQITLDRNGRLWIADSGNNRVLCFVAASYLANNPPADYVFGQPDFTTVASGTTIAKMSDPAGIAVGPDDTLWVADTFNNRILRFAAISEKESGASASGVLGQDFFNTAIAATSDTGMRQPYSLSVDGTGRLWVADTNNNRILRFDNAASLLDGARATGVLGQPNFTENLATTTATGLNFPFGVLVGPDGTLYVADYSNSRVLGFRKAAAKTNGAAADFVLGQPNFTSNSFATTASGLGGPVNLSLSLQGHLFVADFAGNRVVRFVPVKSPAVTITTRSARTTAKTFAIRGRSANPTTKVTYRVGRSGPFRTATGNSSWSFRAPLKRGRNLITVIAEGPGGKSAAKTVTITRR